jgi:hypothetical protein
MTEVISLVAISALVLGAHLAIRECANAVLHGNRDWWKKALYRGQQRQEYKRFCSDLEEVRQLERMGVE